MALLIENTKVDGKDGYPPPINMEFRKDQSLTEEESVSQNDQQQQEESLPDDNYDGNADELPSFIPSEQDSMISHDHGGNSVQDQRENERAESDGDYDNDDDYTEEARRREEKRREQVCRIRSQNLPNSKRTAKSAENTNVDSQTNLQPSSSVPPPKKVKKNYYKYLSEVEIINEKRKSSGRNGVVEQQSGRMTLRNRNNTINN